MESAAPSPEDELERFRAQWKQEVGARSKNPEASSAVRSDHSTSKPQRQIDTTTASTSGHSGSRVREVKDYSEDFEPRVYHDLPNKEDQLRLGQEGQDHDRDPLKEPRSALEHYEKAVERETQGRLGESITHYRTAFKLDDGVQEAYKRKYFPPSSFKPKVATVASTNASASSSKPAQPALHGGSNAALTGNLRQFMEDFSSMRIEPPPPPTDASPQQRSLLGELPEEILIQVLSSLAAIDVASFARLAQVCKRLAFLVMTEQSIWKQIAMDDRCGFPAMHYVYACDIDGFSLEANDEIARYLGSSHEPEEALVAHQTSEDKAIVFQALTELLLHSTYASTWRQMFRTRPRIRFNGCYISTVNYTRAGATSSNTLSWSTPVHVVTYFRYLRFFPDGTAISLLTTSEPADVVHYLTKENLHNHHGNVLPSSVMRDALRGRWRLSGPTSSAKDPLTGEQEKEGDLHIETEGVVAKYTYKLLLALSHAGKGARNNKLAWKGFWSHNRMTDDWAEFGLKNDRAFYWSRVRSY